MTVSTAEKILRPFVPCDVPDTTYQRLVRNGARYDAAPRYPADSMAAITEAGLASVFAPPEAGGHRFAGRSEENAAIFAVLRRVARADLSVARLYEGHINALKLIDWYGNAAAKHLLGIRLAAGASLGVWATEAPPGLTIAIGPDGPRLDGAKIFASGAGGLGFAVVTARLPDGRTQLALARADDPARADATGWRVRGMRATVSGRYDFSGMLSPDVELLGSEDDYWREPRFTAGFWRCLAAHLGGVEGLLIELRAAMSEAARGDPLHRAKFADAVTATRTAYLWVREAALRDGTDDPEAPEFVRLARGMVERAAFDVMEATARVVGARSAFDGERIDKITRDLSLYLRQAKPDAAKDAAALACLDRDVWAQGDRLW